jgi:protein kinase-like protein/PEGA domain-containing protein
VVDESGSTRSVAPGAITALLRDVFRSPQHDPGDLSGFRPGLVVGRFQLRGSLGRGGFGVVFEALDRTLGRSVAFKGVRKVGDVSETTDMLLREAEAAAQLSHPNIVVLHDVGHCEHGPYLVMELLRGRTLADRLADGAMPIEEALHVAREVARGVAHAHARGVVHRDLKPGNVFLCDDGQVKVLDFGLARIFGRPKLEGGTDAYMAPEQRRREAEDERTDVYALGVMLHEMVVGVRPAPGARGLPPSVNTVPYLSGLVSRMLAVDPAARPRDGSEALAALVAASAVPRRFGSRAVAGGRWPRAQRITIATALVAAVGVLALLWRAGPRADSTHAVSADGGLRASAPPPTPPPDTPPRLAQDASARPAPISAPAAAPPRTPARRMAKAVTTSPLAAAATVRFCRGSLDSIPTPSPAAREGVLVVVADPFADVFIDGRAYGETPSECVVSAGVHVVRAEHPRYGKREAHVEVAPGERVRFAADFLGAP